MTQNKYKYLNPIFQTQNEPIPPPEPSGATISHFKRGQKIKSPLWDGLAEILEFEEINSNFFKIKVVKLNSNEFGEYIFSKDDIDKIEIVLDKTEKINFSAKASDVFLAIESIRFKFASIFDPLLAMNISKIDPLPFQIEAVYGYILKLPRIRFLIADDPGAGKTIMAGLVIKEMKLRGLASRILVIVPGHLKDQWIRELKEKFHETFVTIERNTFNALYGENPWEKENQVITSIDFAKQEDILPTLSSVEWDLVVVDEAHKMSAYIYSNKTEKTDRYKLGEIISKNSTHLLFLTATPHKGDPENFRLFLDLLVPGFFSTSKLIEESVKNSDNPLFIRRLKEDLRDFEGKPIFTRREALTIKFRLTHEEKELYNELSKYVTSLFGKAIDKGDKKKNVAFALLILQRRMASSTYALLKSLERRKKKLEKLKEDTVNKSTIQDESPHLGKSPDIQIDLKKLEEIDDYEEKERWEKEREWETITISENLHELNEEIETINNLIEKASRIIKNENEIKLKELKKAIEKGLKKIEEMKGNRKILIFTESRDTLEYLCEKIKSWGYPVNYIHGGMNLEERIKEEKEFRDKTEIMVATDAAGEGINLQFCHIMINYDLPWNPTRLEQRMGRIHRYGQQKDIFVFNLVAEDTREGMVLLKILEKIEEIKKALGGKDKVFDVIGDMFQGKNLFQIIIEAVSQMRSMDDIIKEIDIKIDDNYIKKVKEVLGESLATQFIDYTRINEMAQKAKEYKLVPEYVEEFFKKAFQKAGGKFKIKKTPSGDNFIAIDSIPYEIQKIALDFNFKNKFGSLLKQYPKITFDKEIAFKNPDAEFVSFGHPLLEALIEWIQKTLSTSLHQGAVFKDPEGKFNGIIRFYKIEISDGKEQIVGRKILAIYDNSKELKEINPTVIWDFIPVDDNSINVEPAEENKKIENLTMELSFKYRHELASERKRQTEIKEKYGIRSLEYIIGELDTELVELEERKRQGENVEIVIYNKREKKQKYETALQELKKEIEKEKNLKVHSPQFLGAIYVMPEVKEYKIIPPDEEVEKLGMKIAMEYEIQHGRKPEDVSTQNLGFDIRSKGKDEIRYIEVKTRTTEGEIALTPNEWFKAKRFKDQYYLYIVTNVTANPTLYIIQNPAKNLNAVEKIEAVRFIVPTEEWKSKKIEEWRK